MCRHLKKSSVAGIRQSVCVECSLGQLTDTTRKIIGFTINRNRKFKIKRAKFISEITASNGRVLTNPTDTKR